MTNQIVHNLLVEAGYEPQNIRSVSGGDINAAYAFETFGKKYFLKCNTKEGLPQLFEKEKNGLEELDKYSKFHIPIVIKVGEFEDWQYLVLEFLEEGRPSKKSWEDFGISLAEMHCQTAAKFGFFEDNYLGSRHQDNSYKNDWPTFYAENRILPLVKWLVDEKLISHNHIKFADHLCHRLSEIYPNEAPALTHGDLWSGNYFVQKNSEITILDPAVYYAHREMDLGFAKLFGGFNAEFYDAYHQNFPLESGWENRLRISQLYPLLFHALRFGGSYVGSVEGILKQFS